MEKRAIRDYRDLDIWKRAIDLVQQVYELTADFPTEEQYGLSSQMRKSSVSIPSNIAEGYGRFRINEYKQFLRISFGSGAELITQLIIASRLKYAEDSRCSRLVDEIEQIGKMTMGLIKKLEQSN